MADENYQRVLAEFRRHLSKIAYDAQQRGLAAIDVAGSFWGTGRGVIAVAYGDDAADQWFEQLVRVVKDDDGDDDPRPDLKLVS